MVLFKHEPKSWSSFVLHILAACKLLGGRGRCQGAIYE